MALYMTKYLHAPSIIKGVILQVPATTGNNAVIANNYVVSAT